MRLPSRFSHLIPSFFSPVTRMAFRISWAGSLIVGTILGNFHPPQSRRFGTNEEWVGRKARIGIFENGEIDENNTFFIETNEWNSATLSPLTNVWPDPLPGGGAGSWPAETAGSRSGRTSCPASPTSQTQLKRNFRFGLERALAPVRKSRANAQFRGPEIL